MQAFFYNNKICLAACKSFHRSVQLASLYHEQFGCSFFLRKCFTRKKITLQLLTLANCFIVIRLIVCQVAFPCTISTGSSKFRIEIFIATLLFIIATLLSLKRTFLAFVSIAWKGLSSYCRICFVKVTTDENWFYMSLSWVFVLVIGLVYKDFPTIEGNW